MLLTPPTSTCTQSCAALHLGSHLYLDQYSLIPIPRCLAYCQPDSRPHLPPLDDVDLAVIVNNQHNCSCHLVHPRFCVIIITCTMYQSGTDSVTRLPSQNLALGLRAQIGHKRDQRVALRRRDVRHQVACVTRKTHLLAGSSPCASRSLNVIVILLIVVGVRADGALNAIYLASNLLIRSSSCKSAPRSSAAWRLLLIIVPCSSC